MKKSIAYVLAILMVFSLVACKTDAGSDTTTVSENTTVLPVIDPVDTTASPTEDTTKVVEITLENWRTYFQIQDETQGKFAPVEGSDGEEYQMIESANIYSLCPSNENFHRFISANIEFEFKVTDMVPYWYRRNSEYRYSERIKQCTEQELADYNISLDDSDLTGTISCSLDTFNLAAPFAIAEALTEYVKTDDGYRWILPVYQKIEIVAIHGTVTLRH